MQIVNIKDNSSTFSNTVKAKKPFPTATFIKGSIRRASPKAKENMSGRVGHIIREISFKD